LKYFLITVIVMMTLLVMTNPTVAQSYLDYFGLQNQNLTSLSIYSGIIAVGSDGNGVFWNWEYTLPDSSWLQAGLEGLAVQTVYAHKSGPLGWAIGAGVWPEEGDPIFVYCSYLGQGFETNSEGIVDSLTYAVTGLAGFPDPTICGETYAAGGWALYRRFFGNPDWEPIYTTSIEGNIYTVQAHAEYPGVVLAGGGEGFAGFFLIKSLDFGDTWEDISPLGFVLDVDFVGASADTIFAATGSTVFRYTADSGEWEQVFQTSPPNGDYITEVVIDREQQRVFLAGNSFWYQSPLYYSDDWGITWTQIPTGWLGAIVDLELSDSSALFVAHQSEGLYRLDPDFTDVEDGEDIPTEPVIILRQNYPNPFNPMTTISFDLPRSENVTLVVNSVQGKLITTLLDAYLLAGPYDITWDGRDDQGREMPSGVYFYSLEAGDESAAGKMVLMR
jgi:hypothetical protein